MSKSQNKLDNEDLLDFLAEGTKIGEQTFRDKFGYCPRKLLNMLAESSFVEKGKDKISGLVTYKLIDNIELNPPIDEEEKEDKEQEIFDEPEEEINDQELAIAEDNTLNEIKKKKKKGFFGKWRP